MSKICLNQWNKAVFVMGRAVSVETNTSAKTPAYLLKLDFGQQLTLEHLEKTKRPLYSSSAQLCHNHETSDILDKILLCTLNFPRKQIGKTLSDCLTVGAQQAFGSAEEKRATTVFIQPSSPVEIGSRINIFAQKEIIGTNPRDFEYSEFQAIDLRIGTILDFKKTSFNSLHLISFSVNLGESMGIKKGVGIISKEIDFDLNLGRQLMVLANLEQTAIEENFNDSEAEVILCSVEGKIFLEPAKKIQDGFRMA
jgi:tRNA-binding protein